MEHQENAEEYKGLTVNAGVPSMPAVNPYSTFRRQKRVLSVEDYVAGIHGQTLIFFCVLRMFHYLISNLSPTTCLGCFGSLVMICSW